MADENPSEQVEYDMSFSTNTRINYLLWTCNRSLEQEDPQEWFKACKNLVKESRLNDDEYESHKENMREIEKALNEYNVYVKTYSQNSAANNRAGAIFFPPRKTFDLLYEWERKLRKKLDKMGLLFRKRDEYSL